ncbi:winged helix-turn-helix domain-containing protein [Brevibacillus migulae]|uniref:winged helix-turn-helix domain-containing protein n=1 Tax=Brevibacillus migulae TaxID=1644114 RepID=UPI001430BAC1|nr:winged helix-turn-helix domain-containing protein [Brevibacillus migulae]
MKDKGRSFCEQLRFYPEEFTVQCNGESVTLLPKEYALFEYLFTHANQTFSRVQLLDSVWSMEEPTDRTVDDHIYRLRKKLMPWESWIRIDTIRGYGYKLAVKVSPPPVAPLLYDPETNAYLEKLIGKYHGYGMGAALQTLAANQSVLGLKIPPFYEVYTRFVSGDFHWIAQTDSLTFWEKSCYLLNLYTQIQFDAEQALYYWQQAAKSKHLFPEEWQKEVELNMFTLYMETERIEEGRALHESIRELVFGMDSPSFRLFWYVHRLYLAILTHDRPLAEDTIASTERLLQEHPVQRELGLYTIAKGLWKYHQQEQNEARHFLGEGVRILQQTQFVPHLLTGIHHILHYLRKYRLDDETLRTYEKLWRNLQEKYNLPQLEQIITSILRTHL